MFTVLIDDTVNVSLMCRRKHNVVSTMLGSMHDPGHQYGFKTHSVSGCFFVFCLFVVVVFYHSTKSG